MSYLLHHVDTRILFIKIKISRPHASGRKLESKNTFQCVNGNRNNKNLLIYLKRIFFLKAMNKCGSRKVHFHNLEYL